MLRMILGSGRAPLGGAGLDDDTDVNSNPKFDDNAETLMWEEDSTNDSMESWADWLIRTTRQIEQQCDRLRIKNWVHQARALKWKLSVRIHEQDCQRWSHRLLLWNPETMFDGLHGKAHRKRAHPHTRWMDDIKAFQSLMSTHDSEGSSEVNEFIHGTWREQRPMVRSAL